jgi:membrane associated rhomboid family serine protease
LLPLKDNVPTRRFPAVTVGLIAVNAAVWLFYELPHLNRAVAAQSFYPCRVDASCHLGHPWPLAALTSMFMHGSWWHIIGNMLFLWIFGNNVEDAMGRVKFLVFYLLSGFAAAALQTWITLQFASHAGATVPNLGASGAISGVLGAYFLLLPRAKVLTLVFFFIVNIPAMWFLGIWFLFQLLSGSGSVLHPSSQGGGVAFFAHVGGFVFGMLTVYLFAGRGRPLQPKY